MKLRNRFALVILGILIFLVITPILIVYAGGFRVDWKNRTLIKTGALVVKTQPTKADVFLNDLKQSSDTPASIRFLAPGDYNVRVSKNDYQSWTKRLSVKSQLVTWANIDRDFITLFLVNPIPVNSWVGNNITLNKNEITFLKGAEPTKLNVENAQTDNISVLPQPTVPQTAKQITDMLTLLNITAPAFTTGKIIQTNSQIYAILDQNLYIVNDDLEKIYGPVTEAFWDEDSGQLLYANDNELYVYHPDSRNSDLILRSLTKINNPILNSETGYIFFQNENKVKAVELDGRDHRNIYTITDAADNFTISSDGKRLFTFNQSKINEFTIR